MMNNDDDEVDDYDEYIGDSDEDSDDHGDVGGDNG